MTSLAPSVVKNKTHARLSPSSSQRWMNCPGSVRLIESLEIVDITNKYAAEGTAAHEIHERALKTGNDAKDYIGNKITVDDYNIIVTEQMTDAVQISLDYVRQRIAENQSVGYTVALAIETRASLEHLNIRGLDGGTSDVVLLVWNDDELVEIEVIDYKHGAYITVDAEHNTQMLCYAAGVVHTIVENSNDNTQIRLTISQPQAWHPDGPARSWYLSITELEDWIYKDLVPRANATVDVNALLVPSDEACCFCPATGQCPKMYERTHELAVAEFSNGTFPAPETMSSEQKITIMDHAEMIRNFISAVESQVKIEVEKGSKDYEAKYKLVHKTTHRKLTEAATDPDFSPLLDYLKEDELYERKVKGLGALESALKQHITLKKAKELIDSVTEKPEGDLVIASIKDKRKAARLSITNDFTNINI